MKLILFARNRFRLQTICSGGLAEVTIRTAECCGAQAPDIIVRIRRMAAVGVAFETRREAVGDYRIKHEVRGRSPWFVVSQRVVFTAPEIIDVVDIAEAKAIYKARSPEGGVIMQQGGKSVRVDAGGKVYKRGAMAGGVFSDDVLAKTVPVVVLFKSYGLRGILA